MAIPKIRNIDRFTPDAHTLLEAARARRAKEVQWVSLGLAVDQTVAKRLIFLSWLREKGRLSS